MHIFVTQPKCLKKLLWKKTTNVCMANHVRWWPDNFNTLRPGQNGRHFPDDLFQCIFLNENVWIAIKISLKFVSKCLIVNIPALVQIMAWRRLGDKPLSEPMIVRLPTHICVIRPQWVKYCGEERRHKWRAVEEEEASTSGPLQRGLLTWGIAAAL